MDSVPLSPAGCLMFPPQESEACELAPATPNRHQGASLTTLGELQLHSLQSIIVLLALPVPLILVSSHSQLLQPGFGAGGLLGLQPQLHSMEVPQDLPLRRGGTQLRATGKTGPRTVGLQGSCVRDPSAGGRALPTCSWGCPASWAQPRASWKHGASTS